MFYLRYYDDALKDAVKGIDMGVEGKLLASAYKIIGQVCRMKEDLTKAAEYFSKAIELDPENGDYYHFRGLTYKLMDDY